MTLLSLALLGSVAEAASNLELMLYDGSRVLDTRSLSPADSVRYCHRLQPVTAPRGRHWPTHIDRSIPWTGDIEARFEIIPTAPGALQRVEWNLTRSALPRPWALSNLWTPAPALPTPQRIVGVALVLPGDTFEITVPGTETQLRATLNEVAP